jgi:hypothetical protein
MRADGVDTVGGEGLVGLDDKVGRITLQDTHDLGSQLRLAFTTSESFRMIIIVWTWRGLLTLSPWASVRSLGPCVLSQSSTRMSLPSLSLATIPPALLPELWKKTGHHQMT